MITIFTTTKDFTGIYEIIQMNALKSWRYISPDIEIIIFGDSKGSKEAAKVINAKYIPDIKYSPYHTPILSDLLYRTDTISKYSLIMEVKHLLSMEISMGLIYQEHQLLNLEI